MANSVLRAFVSGTRQVLTAQLFVSVTAVALSGWTLAVTNDVIRERDRLRERIIQLEGDMGSRGIVVPSPATVVDPAREQAETVYPDEVGLAEDGAPSNQDETPTEPAAEPTEQTFRPTQILGDLFTPAPPMRTLVLHARGEPDAELARRLAEEFGRSQNVHVVVNVVPPRDPRPTGYTYYDGRQSRAAAALVARFNDLARQQEIAAWSAQLRATALPAQGEYTADRLDVVLPPLPQRPATFDRVNPNLIQREVVRPQSEPAPIR